MSWSQVRYAVNGLHWGDRQPQVDEPLADWAATAAALVHVRSQLGPITGDDPINLLSLALAGAARADRSTEPARSLGEVRRALILTADEIAHSKPEDADHHILLAEQTGYEVAHWMRAQSVDHNARPWILAADNAMWAAVNAPTPPSSRGAKLAAWQEALVVLEPMSDHPAIRSAVAAGHWKILRAAHREVQRADAAGAINRHWRGGQPDTTYTTELLDTLKALGRCHRESSDQPAPRPATRQQHAALMRLAEAVTSLLQPDHDDDHTKLDALLRTGLGHSAIATEIIYQAGSLLGRDVKTIANAPGWMIERASEARSATDSLDRLVQEYLQEPRILRRGDWEPAAPPIRREPLPREHAQRTAVVEASVLPAEPPREPPTPRVGIGERLTDQAIAALCAERDLGKAAETADPSHPPALLTGTDPATWPSLIDAGRQAVIDLVVSVTPMTYRRAHTYPPNLRDDVVATNQLKLMEAARTYDPAKGPWPVYASVLIGYTRGFDQAGIPNKKSTTGRETVSVDPQEDDLTRFVDRTSVADQAIGEVDAAKLRDRISQLPPAQRNVVRHAADGMSTQEIANATQISLSTVRRQLIAAREALGESEERRARSRQPQTDDEPRRPPQTMNRPGTSRRDERGR